jgi:pyruvate dehydrogenase E2 component (dihydrolipoamide acetyltransferase)
MRTEFELPDVGEGVAEGELVAWHVDVGDRVEEDQTIAEVETDKALVEIPSPHDGEIVELRAAEGEIVPVDDVIVVFEIEDETTQSATANETVSGTDGADGARTDATSTDEPAVDDGESTSGGRVFAPPSVRRLARELGVDIEALQSRSSGRVGERTVRKAAGETQSAGAESETDGVVAKAGSIETEPERATATTTATGSSGDRTGDRDGELASGVRGSDSSERADRKRTLAMPATRRLAREAGIAIDAVPASERHNDEPFVTPADVRTYAADGQSSAAPEGNQEPTTSRPERAAETDTTAGTRVPYTGIRRTIGEQMATSKYTAPHVSHHDEVEVADLVDARTRLKEVAEDRDVSLTYLPFAIKAVVAALKTVPSINAELDEEAEEIVRHDEYNIGIAVASDAGLMVPVIDDADRKGLLEIAREVDDKAERARNRTIELEEMRGGTFTITNVGAVGGEYATPIINYPEAGILALGSLKERPWAEDSEIVARPTLPISMSVDHRIVDGAEAAKFTNEVKRYLHDPELLLLE